MSVGDTEKFFPLNFKIVPPLTEPLIVPSMAGVTSFLLISLTEMIYSKLAVRSDNGSAEKPKPCL